jgi:hypothetical protein
MPPFSRLLAASSGFAGLRREIPSRRSPQTGERGGNESRVTLPDFGVAGDSPWRARRSSLPRHRRPPRIVVLRSWPSPRCPGRHARRSGVFAGQPATWLRAPPTRRNVALSAGRRAPRNVLSGDAREARPGAHANYGCFCGVVEDCESYAPTRSATASPRDRGCERRPSSAPGVESTAEAPIPGSFDRIQRARTPTLRP